MILFNKLVRTDGLLLIGVACLLMIKTEPWNSILLGFCAALFIFSIFHHIRHFKLYKKFY
jgi:hypothetical protein